MFAKFHGFSRYTQYEFVVAVLKGRPPASDPRNSTSIYNSAAGPKDFIPFLQGALPRVKSTEYVTVSDTPTGRFTEGAIKKFIDAGRIMIYGSGSHAKILCGYGKRADKDVLVAVDPEAAGNIPVEWSDFDTCAWVVYVPKG